MQQSTVIVRAFEGEPLKRVVVEAGDKRVSVALPDTLHRIASGEACAISLPRADLFQYDEGAYARLVAEWRTKGSTNPQTWRSLKAWTR